MSNVHGHRTAFSLCRFQALLHDHFSHIPTSFTWIAMAEPQVPKPAKKPTATSTEPPLLSHGRNAQTPTAETNSWVQHPNADCDVPNEDKKHHGKDPDMPFQTSPMLP